MTQSTAEADGRLIKAAPKLLAACRMFVDMGVSEKSSNVISLYPNRKELNYALPQRT